MTHAILKEIKCFLLPPFFRIKIYRATYNKAVTGKSLRAAINAFCLECVCWQRKEIQLCTSLSCPLFAVRPYQLPQKARDGGFIGAESKKSQGNAYVIKDR